ncbi:ATP-grasp domain-containing protein [Streptomyces bambusae]|uniref:ATP-grasp domain-containing protein n=1 Tax=Streptomyces bambusae TaxID=1550616 RepID=UPI001CFC9388|nr:ATP-grasp domain-containing protein [Streptomyces bambusae]MCB5167435.1 ATP-grasp domain-containing protein [Streptomyces bambusae]
MFRAVAALHRSGAEVTCVLTPGDTEAARREFPNMRTVLVTDQTSVDQALAGLERSGLDLRAFDAVCSGLEFCLATAAVLSDLARITDRAAFGAVAMRDKDVQKSLVRAAGVSTAQCVAVSGPADVAAHPDRFPVVVKPLSGSGALDTFRIDGRDALDAYVRTTDTKGPWLVEEFISGAEFQVDGVVSGGEVTFLSMGRYLENIIDIHDGGLVGCIALPPALHVELYENAKTVARDSLKALEHADGVFHMEVFVRDGDIVFGECGARVGGGRTDEVVERSFGVNLHDEWVRGVLRRPTGPAGPGKGGTGSVHGDMHLYAPQGLVRQVPSTDEVLARPGVVHVELKIAPGATMPDVTSASYLHAGVAVVSGADDREVESRMRELSDWFAASVVTE